MSTTFILPRNTHVTRQQVLQQFPNAFISDDDKKEGLTIDNASLCVYDNTDHAWVYFTDDDVDSIEVYGSNGFGAVKQFCKLLNVEVFSEHSKQFDYHSFPYDVKNDQPQYKHNGWNGYVDDNHMCYMYNSDTDQYFYPEEDFPVTDLHSFRKFIKCIIESYVLSD